MFLKLCMFESSSTRLVSNSTISMQCTTMILSHIMRLTVIKSRKLAGPASLANILKTVDNIFASGNGIYAKRLKVIIF